MADVATGWGDEPIDRLVIGVHADTAGFAREVQQMRESLEGPLAQGADKAGRMIETSLIRAAASGRLGFDTLRTVALGALEQIEARALRLGLNQLIGGGSDGNASGGGLGGVLQTLVGGLLGQPGRATGGPVSPGAAYLVGERGPELFVPTTSGSIAAAGSGGGGGRDVRVAITVNAGAGQAAGALQQSSRQVARAVKAALEG